MSLVGREVTALVLDEFVLVVQCLQIYLSLVIETVDDFCQRVEDIKG